MHTATGIGYDRAGPQDQPTVVLIHAGVADRRMWDSLWDELAADRDALRLDLRGFGASVQRPAGPLDPVADVLDTLTELGIERAHLVGASFGAGVAVELALTRPELVGSLLLAAPGGSLIAERTPDLNAFIEAERAAMSNDDLDAAVDANLAWWVDGPSRDATAVDPEVRELVRQMQRRAFELTVDWDDVTEHELDPPALQRLGELDVATLVLVGALDLQAILDTANLLTDEVTGAVRVDWPDTAHLPSMERPADFYRLLRNWLARNEG